MAGAHDWFDWSSRSLSPLWAWRAPPSDPSRGCWSRHRCRPDRSAERRGSSAIPRRSRRPSTSWSGIGLPRVEVRVVFLPDRPAFEALLREIGYPPDLAADAAADMRAIGGYRNILVNESRLSPLEWGDRTALFAHELVHVLQYELGGGVRGASDQWLREGLAEWVELEVLESLQVIGSSAHARRLALDQLRSLIPEEVPRLTALRTFPEWVAAGRGGAARRLYDLGLTAVDGLIDRHGMDAVLRYFGRFAAAQDAEGNFLASFGQSVAEFDEDLRCRLYRC